MADTARSIGVVRKPRTVSALAPYYTFVISTEELSILGYCCTGRVVMARHPTSTITRFTTTARTGCLMKVSVTERMNSVPLTRRIARDQHSLAQLEGPRGGDLLARGETAQDHDLVVQHRPAAHRLVMSAGPAARG